jgi:inorganic pyrophosphatase
LFAEYQDLDDVANHYLREVEHFFATYKQLEGAVVEPRGWEGAAKGTEEVRAAVARYHQHHQQAMLGGLGSLSADERKRET